MLNSCSKIYLVVTADTYELPVGVFDTLAECSEFLSVSIFQVCRAIRFSSIVDCKYRVYRVYA